MNFYRWGKPVVVSGINRRSVKIYTGVSTNTNGFTAGMLQLNDTTAPGFVVDVALKDPLTNVEIPIPR